MAKETPDKNPEATPEARHMAVLDSLVASRKARTRAHAEFLIRCGVVSV